MKYWVFTAQWIVLATALNAAQQKVAPPKSTPPPSGNRYLFVVETSAAMIHFEHAGRQAVFDLIYSGVDGRMRRGDSYGVWTFNEEVFAGQYPMQVWTDNKSALNHASKVGRFLKAQPYVKAGKPESVFKHLAAIARAAKDVNVLIISAGGTPVAGTPFDEQINGAYTTNLLQPPALRKPLVTTLTIRNGQYTAACVTPAGEPIELVDLPKRTSELALAKSTTDGNTGAHRTQALGEVVSLGEAEDPKRVSTNAAIIMRNTNAKPVHVETTKALVAVPQTEPSAINVEPIATNELAKTEEQKPAVMPIVSAPPPTNALRVPETHVADVPIPAVGGASNGAPVARPEPLPAALPAGIQAQAREVNAVSSTATPSTPSGLSFILMLVLGGAFVGGALVFALFWVRRWRATPQTSFISRGMDRY